MAAMFAARPPATPPLPGDLHLVRAAERGFTGSAAFLADAANRARVGEYLADVAGPYGRELRDIGLGGQSYGEMAEALIGLVTSADEPVDLLVLAFSMHDLWPGRPASAYLSHVTPGAPMAFAICDQGSAAAFSGLRIIREYASSGAIGRALLIVVEQAVLPYDVPETSGPLELPAQHQGVALLYRAVPDNAVPDNAAAGDAKPLARVVTVRQHPGVAPGDVASLAAAEFAELTAADPAAGLILGAALAETWTDPAAKQVRVMPPGQPATAVWRGLTGELAGDGDVVTGNPGLVVIADYDPGLRYLCLATFMVAGIGYGLRPGADEAYGAGVT
jgi:hypothetical protein